MRDNPSPPDQIFAIIFGRGPAWLEDHPVFEQPLAEHGAYELSLFQAGTLLSGGPFLDDSGGLSIIRCADRAAAEAIIAADPAVAKGIMSAELRPWYQVDWTTYGS